MNAAAQTFALIEALIYIGVFPLESFLLGRPFAQRFLSTPAADVPAVMMWAFNVGFRNLFLGLGVITGVVLLNTGREAAGTTLVIFCCVNMVLSAWLMGVSDLLGHYPERGASVPGTLAASVPALIALIAAAF
ncbi:DUF1304 domain-containing protein [Planobispora longispora]|uniref:Membrane protein n=1 Tax=Planobispora longispora TaxID=28887 RepID=A0A8J3RR64_9ACTN|nr:DUF1304 domain-containing protein [Planobispora longispora]BFE83825.1 DUF1304 domain-containing protein [Planobispora longispora]GIH78357.1 membrane protein [Planobispora longispora]